MKMIKLLLVMLFSIAVVACGGGGGSGSGTGSTTPVSATANTTAQYLTVGTAMTSFTPLTASGGTAPYTYSHTGTLPTGLSFSASTGAVTGTPTAAYATANLVVSVQDANNVAASTTSSVSFTVTSYYYASQGGLAWMPITFQDTWANANTYCINTTINSWTDWRMPTQTELSALYTAGAMNVPGWVLGNTWSSTPYGAGSHYSVTLNVGYVDWYRDTGLFYVSCVHGINTGNAITATATTTAQNLTVNTAMTSFTPLTASGGTPPYTYSHTGTLPTGLSFSASTGAVTGIPTAAYATASLVFSVRDANNNYASTTSTVSFTVSAASGLPAGYVLQGGLTWMPVSGTWYTYAEATALCAGTINGQTGWRLPTQTELSALSGAMNMTGWTNTNVSGWTVSNTWSSTPYGTYGNAHYIVDLFIGVVDWDFNTSTRFVSCVR
jgi:hypothetical protein